MTGSKTTYRLFAVGVAVLCFFGALLVLAGCVQSDKITERVYDNEETSKLDEDLSPVLVNSIKAKQTSEELPKLANDPHSDVKNDSDDVTPLYSPDPSKAQTDKPAPRPMYSKGATNAGEASVKTKEDVETETEQATNPNSSQENDNGATEQESKSSKKKGKKGKGKSKEGEGGSGGDDGEGDGGNGGAKRSSGGTGDTYSSDPNAEEPDIPENIDEVAAVGNAAVIVSILSGSSKKTSLLACDKATKSQASSVLADRGISKAQALWKNDGSSTGDLTSANFDKLLNDVVPDLVYVTEGSDTLTAAQRKKLAKRNIDVYELPELTSAKRIRFAVRVIGMTLAEGGVDGVEENYKAYLDFHDDLVKKYSKGNGGMTGGFDFDDAESVDGAPETVVTLYMDKWDESARFNDKNGYITTASGIGVSTLGYKMNPTSYYMSAGGVLNNAASSVIRKLDTNKAGIVWQFAQAELGFKFGRWDGLSNATYDLCDHISGGVYKSDLLWYTPSSGDGFGLGTEQFPALTVKSQKIGSLVEKSAKKAGQPYYPYPTISPGAGKKTVGFVIDEAKNSYVESCIGNDGKSGTSALDGKMYPVYTNPKGLCQKDSDDALCSWTDGSVESVLETSWAHYRFRGGSQGAFRDDVSEFYKQFYGYDLSSSELDSIEAGAKE